MFPCEKFMWSKGNAWFIHPTKGYTAYGLALDLSVYFPANIREHVET